MTINALGGASFEAGSLVELNAFHSSGVSVVTSPAPASALETYSCKLENPASASAFIGIGETASETDWITVGWYLRLDRTFGTRDFALFSCSGGGREDLRLEMDISSGDVKFYNGNGSLTETLSNPFNDNQWYRVILKFKRKDSPAGLRLWIDGTKVVDITTDLLDGSGTSTLQFRGPSQSPSQEAFYYISSCWAITDDGADIDTNDTTRRDWHAKIYQKTNGTASSVGPEDDLDGGTWADASEVLVDYTDSAMFDVPGTGGTKVGGVTTFTGSRPGPRNDSDVEGADPILAIWAWRFKQTAGFGNTNFIGRIGRQIVGQEDVPAMIDIPTQVASRTDWKHTNYHAASTAERMPSLDRWFQQGFKGTATSGPGARDISTSHMFCALIFEEAAPTGRLALIDGKMLLVE